ncbi:hypothetical protein [Kitasatospora viridis]|uniref:Uncharacterized protein n=1 Tax=Kitasatospora viridis TaxID=281105 RepID=A0A561S9H1_9ACTN|nr:hypothetical protein [Kitasatospora viridis]TWF71510.1 hypothetical protein FHX73_19140 [Kitasatospora viridis]
MTDHLPAEPEHHTTTVLPRVGGGEQDEPDGQDECVAWTHCRFALHYED